MKPFPPSVVLLVAAALLAGGCRVRDVRTVELRVPGVADEASLAKARAALRALPDSRLSNETGNADKCLDVQADFASGTLKLTGALPPYEPAMPASDDCVLHLDALDADTLTLVDHSDGVKRVSEWRSKTANGWRAVPSSDSVDSYPRFAADDGLANDAASVRMPGGIACSLWMAKAAA